MKAQPHPQQAARLRVLQSYGILDTPPEGAFDEVVTLVAEICECPVVLISLVEEHRQWFKARVGMSASETDMERSICAHAILDGDFLEINDTLSDLRTADNPLCIKDDSMRFYAGAVLKSDEGLPIGTLCILDRKPRVLTDMQRRTMRVMADQVMAQLNLRRALNTADVLRREVDHRVKNSLQSVTAIMRMQSRHTLEETVREALDTARIRIETVAALHEQLYLTESGAQIDVARFAENVCILLGRSAPETVTIRASCDPLWAGSRKAASIGTILNEFGTNAIKHAFPDNRPGVVSFELRSLGGGMAQLSCSDDGVGMPEGADDGQGLGLKVLRASAQQLGGDPVLETGPAGTRVSVVFPVSDEPMEKAAQ
ncbi:histidine kinase dimerization/phosphoacceptor domain -containing protein [Maritimibacter alkaliphilus]|uniref:histidine kinase dimerization/phosphoacceptor domain -containing protein n=1 Tax=Maritimibacter alkaliphilus TaxID=404236 RepID=UPI001C984852|nr:histidine kinase dimerization/phosphoacceptor domain -containing protein [Maritimibacter alkaliphilus]MBY6090423.1 GAF domain-containing protein [Maritimibacter alkaliphilus]